MIRILQYIVFGHVHKYKIIDTHALNEKDEVIGICYDLQCETSSNVKFKKYLA